MCIFVLPSKPHSKYKHTKTQNVHDNTYMHNSMKHIEICDMKQHHIFFMKDARTYSTPTPTLGLATCRSHDPHPTLTSTPNPHSLPGFY